LVPVMGRFEKPGVRVIGIAIKTLKRSIKQTEDIFITKKAVIAAVKTELTFRNNTIYNSLFFAANKIKTMLKFV